MAKVVLLGPQRHDPTIGEVVKELALAGPFALLTAGWLEHEPDDAELREAIGGEAFNLRVYQRSEQVFVGDGALRGALSAFRARLDELRAIYRVRIAAALGAATRLLGMEGDDELVGPECEDAMAAVRSLDAHHLGRVEELHEAFWSREGIGAHEGLMGLREELTREVGGASTVLVAGGHVGELSERLWLLDMAPILRERSVLAWSAGAMALSERIVLFHDSPPQSSSGLQGEGHPEVLRRGLGLFPRVLPLPHGSARLRVGDPARVRAFARRFPDHRAVVLDPRVRLDWRAPAWRPMPGTRVLAADGTLAAWEGD
jgi:hypothetical protein